MLRNPWLENEQCRTSPVDRACHKNKALWTLWYSRTLPSDVIMEGKIVVPCEEVSLFCRRVERIRALVFSSVIEGTHGLPVCWLLCLLVLRHFNQWGREVIHLANPILTDVSTYVWPQSRAIVVSGRSLWRTAVAHALFDFRKKKREERERKESVRAFTEEDALTS